MKEFFEIGPENFNHQMIESIKKEMDLYKGLVGLVCQEKKVIASEDIETLAIIIAEKQRQIAEIEEMEARFAQLRRKWKKWSGRNKELVLHWVDRLSSIIQESASRQHENQELLENLLKETHIQINKLKSCGHVPRSYSSKGKCFPRFIDIKR